MTKLEKLIAKNMKTKKDLAYYMALPWSYSVEQEESNGTRYFIVYCNELRGICTDAETIEEAMALIKEPMTACIEGYMERNETVPEPATRDKYQGKISYRTTSERHYGVAKMAHRLHKSFSKTMDDLIDIGMREIKLGH